jgi:hydrogenase maturation protease
VTHVVLIGDGRIVVPRATYDLYLGGAGSAALLERDGQVYLLPLGGPVAGGMLLKRRNLDGDRILLATDFLAERGLGRFTAEREFHVRWVAEAGALLIEGLSPRARA